MNDSFERRKKCKVGLVNNQRAHEEENQDLDKFSLDSETEMIILNEDEELSVLLDAQLNHK